MAFFIPTRYVVAFGRGCILWAERPPPLQTKLVPAYGDGNFVNFFESMAGVCVSGEVEEYTRDEKKKSLESKVISMQ